MQISIITQPRDVRCVSHKVIYFVVFVTVYMHAANGTIHADALCNVIGIYGRANLTLKLELAVRKRQPASWRGVCVCVYLRQT